MTSRRTKKEKSHARAPGVTQTSIAINESTLKRLSKIAGKSYRSRNQVITMFLEQGIEEWLKEHPEHKDGS